MPKNIKFALLLMGFTSLIVQTLLIREFLISFYGNELTIGLILANWIILEALGSSALSKPALKSTRPHLAYALLQTGISLYLPLSVFFIRNVKNMLGVMPGEGIGIIPILASSFFILAPLSILDGAQFPFGCRMLEDSSGKPLESAGKAYVLEAIGFILAGPLFTYLLITKLNSFYIVLCLGLLNLVSAISLIKDKLRDKLTRFSFALIGILAVSSIVTLFGPAQTINRFSIKKQWQGKEVVEYKNSIYANLIVTKSAEQYTFYSDGIPIITTPVPDITFNEELAHFALLSHTSPKNILILSGGAGGIINETLKYPVEKITYCELDPELIKLIKDFKTPLTQKEFNDNRLEIKNIDARRFLRLTKEKYDSVLVNLPMPSTLQLNRFYTAEFFQNVKRCLNEDGIFIFSLPGSLSYLNLPLRNLNGSILNTLKNIFYVNVVPGDFNLYLCAKNKFQISAGLFSKRLRERKISTLLLDEFHLQERLHPRWQNWFYHSLSDYARIRKNSDLLPSGTFYSISYWNTAFAQNLQWLFALLDKLDFKFLLSGILFLGVILFLWQTFMPQLKKLPVVFAVSSTGFIGMSLNLIFIYMYQSFYGFVFSHLALLVTAFMAGLTLGGWLMNKRLTAIKESHISFLKIELGLFIFCLLVGPLLLFLAHLSQPEFSYLFFLFTAIAGYYVGSEFPLANKIYTQGINFSRTAGIIYALDLFGGWVAALVISVALVPVIGIIKTCLLLAVLKLISLILLVCFRKNLGSKNI